MKKRIFSLIMFFLIMAAACSSAAGPAVTDGLIYDETDNTWASCDEDLAELVGIMKNECMMEIIRAVMK